MSVLEVRNLRVALRGEPVVDGVSLALDPGRIVAVVGESGAGKSQVLRALLGLSPAGAAVTADVLAVAGEDLRRADERRWRRIRGARVALIGQDALTALDPLRRIRDEVVEAIEVHGVRATTEEALELLRTAAVPEPHLRARQYSFELSGGLRQRALIASALAAGPSVLLADEPTTALDATVQHRVLGLLRELADDGRAVLLVSHDLGAVAGIADEIAVMRHGRIVEHGPAERVLHEPQHGYTRALWAASRRTVAPAATGAGDVVLEATRLTRRFGPRTAVDAVSVQVRANRVLGIVGESGSGKTTLARMLVGADRPDAGAVRLDGRPWNPAPASARRTLRAQVQLVSQSPRSAFDPTWSIGRSIGEALAVSGMPKPERAERTAALLRQVELDPALAGRRPATLSGGQLQRAAIARALASGPRVLVLDEPLSALDVSVAAAVLDLLRRVQADTGVAVVFVSHDLRVVGELADEVLVMRDGAVVEQGPTAAVFADPQHPFTRELLDARPTLWDDR